MELTDSGVAQPDQGNPGSVQPGPLPDPSRILERLAIKTPLIGFYDAPDAAPFEPLVMPNERECVFAFLQHWLDGKTLHLTKERHGCGGGHLFGIQPRSREEMIDFLYSKEGLRATPELVGEWLDAKTSYAPMHGHLLFGPLRPAQYEYLRTVTFCLNPDQLAVLCTGAAYYSRPGDPDPVVCRFGSGCMQLTSVFDSLEVPQASIGSTDHSMRRFLPPWMILFTVTRPMFELLCRWSADPGSSLHSEFTDNLLGARGGSLAVKYWL